MSMERVTKRLNRAYKEKNRAANLNARAATQSGRKVWTGVNNPSAPHSPDRSQFSKKGDRG